MASHRFSFLLLALSLCVLLVSSQSSDADGDEEDEIDPSPNGGILCDTIANCSDVGTEGCLAGKCVCLEDYTCGDCSEKCVNGIWGDETCSNACTGEIPIPAEKKRSDAEIAGIVIALLLAFAALMLFLQYMLSPLSMSKEAKEEAKAEARAEQSKASQVVQAPLPMTQPISPSVVDPAYDAENGTTVTPYAYPAPPSAYTGYTDDTGSVISGTTAYSGYTGTVPFSDTSYSGYSGTATAYTPSAYSQGYAPTESLYSASGYTGAPSTVTYVQSSSHHHHQPL